MKKLLLCFIILTSMLTSLSNVSIAQWVRQTSGTTEILYDVAFCNLNTGIVVGESGIMLRTTNKGTTWTQLTSLTPDYLFTVYFINENTGWVAGANSFIYKTTNRGNNWQSQNFEIQENIHDIFFLDENFGVAVGRSGFIIMTSNGGTNWAKPEATLTQHLNGVFFIDANTGWIAGGAGKNIGTIYSTTDGGRNWEDQTSGTDQNLYSVWFSNANTGIIVGSEGVVLRTTDGGNLWFTQPSETSAYLTKVDFLNSVTGIAIGYSGIILRTTNGGVNWVQQVSGTGQSLLGISFPDKYFNLGWAVGSGGTILRYTGAIPNVPYNFHVEPSTEIGKALLSWQDSSDNESGFIIHRRDIVNTNWIILDTVEANETQYLDSGLAADREYSWRMYSYNVIGRSAYTDTVSIVLSNVQTVNEIIPEKYNLYQNFPNPFNPSTTISFDIPKAETVKLVIYDMLGKEITQLVNGVLQPGKYEINWNAAVLPSGAYFYKLQAGNFTSIKKLVLSK